MADRKSNKPWLTENVVIVLIDRLGLVVSQLLKWGTFAFIAYCIQSSIQALAGKYTMATFVAQFVASWALSAKIAWTVTFLVAIGWSLERKLRKKRTGGMAREKKLIELKIDPKRTSSTLPESGDTRKDDE